LRLVDLLTRANDEALQSLVGQAPMRLILLLDPSLATPARLRTLILEFHGEAGLLLSPQSRSILFELLREDEARALTTILDVAANSDAVVALQNTTFQRNSRREEMLFRFFEVPLPKSEAPDLPPTQVASVGQYSLFEHQRKAVYEIKERLRARPHRVVLHMPTGAGKTRTAMNIIAEHLREHEPTLVVWLAQTEELCEQSAAEFEGAWARLGNREVDIFRFWGAHSADASQMKDGIVVAGLAKLYSAATRSIGFINELASKTSLVIIDEAHSAIAETYKLILDALVVQKPDTALLGLTATPGRTWADIEIDDELARFFARQKVTLHVDGYDNPVDYLVDQGYLARADYEQLLYEGGLSLTDSDLSRIRESFDIPDNILRLLAEDEQRNLQIIVAAERLAKNNQRILIFAATVQHAHLLATILRARGHNADAVTGLTPPLTRSRVIERFKEDDGETRILCNFGILTTGFDAPRTSAAIIARPTKSLVLYSQMVGRAIRGPKAGGNSRAHIVTVVDYDLPGFGSVADAFENWEDVWE